jgi:hypothetical protein
MPPVSLAPLSSSEWLLVRGVGFECVVDDVGEASLEDAEGFEAAVAVDAASGDERLCGRVPVGLGERDAVDRGVELSVAGAAESVALPVRGPDGQWRGAVVACVGVLALEAFDAGGLTEDLRCRQRPAAADRDQRGRELLDQRGDLALELVDLDRQRPAAIDEVAGDPGDGPLEGCPRVGLRSRLRPRGGTPRPLLVDASELDLVRVASLQRARSRTRRWSCKATGPTLTSRES